MIISTTNQKGGVGKSTIAVHLVAWLRENDISVALVDADAQNSSSDWVSSLDPEVPIYKMETSDDILEKVKELPEKVVIIDGPAGLSDVTRSILLISDMTLIPCGPSALDLDAANNAVRTLKQVQAVRGNLPVGYLVPNKLQRNYRLSKEMVEMAGELGLEVAPGLGLRQVFADSAGQRSVVWKMGVAGKVAEEELMNLMAKLFTIVEGENEQAASIG